MAYSKEIEIECYYFGCWNQPGHFLFDKDGNTVYEWARQISLKDFPIKINYLDSTLLGYQDVNSPQFKCILSHIGNWTIISFWDRTIDKRPGSNSNFIMRYRWDFHEAVNIARRNFPTIFNRFPSELIYME